MPTRSPGDVPAGTVETLGLPARAVTALTRAGITDAAALAALSRRELAAVPGLGAGLVTAIRRVVPEPPATLPRGRAAGDGEAPAAPPMPSFASLRDPRRRTALDLLVPAAVPAGDGADDRADTGPAPRADAEPEPEPEPEPAPEPAPDPVAVRRAAPAPRPAEYADLVHLGARLARAAVTVPGRLALWSVRTQVGLLRRLLGG